MTALPGRLPSEPRVIIVADSASARFGGEAILPLHYYRIQRRRGLPVWLVVHERTRAELEETFGNDECIHFVPDTRWHRLAWRLGSRLPSRVSHFTIGIVLRLLTQRAQKKVVRQLIAEQGANVVHQPTPVSPKEPSLLYGLGVPVIFGPMNGGMQYPPAFRSMEGWFERISVAVARALSGLVNLLVPGKRHAALLLVANPRTAAALPPGSAGRVVAFVENGVDLSLWAAPMALPPRAESHARYVFMGRLVEWKAVDLLLRAFARASAMEPMSLLIAGDGHERVPLEALARDLGLLGNTAHASGKVAFAGWKSQRECTLLLSDADALVLPSMFECGGAVVLEAMAMSLPVIATDWGGPADYLDPSCGILVRPLSRETFIDDLASALVRLARAPVERQQMGRAGRTKVTAQYDWETKVDRMLTLYQQVLATGAGEPRASI